MGSVEAASILIDPGTETTAQEKQGWIPLHRGSEWGDTGVALFKLPIELGADMTARDNDGSTPLYRLVSSLEVAEERVMSDE